jgi:hypothetical protein
METLPSKHADSPDLAAAKAKVRSKQHEPNKPPPVVFSIFTLLDVFVCGVQNRRSTLAGGAHPALSTALSSIDAASQDGENVIDDGRNRCGIHISHRLLACMAVAVLSFFLSHWALAGAQTRGWHGALRVRRWSVGRRLAKDPC